MTTWCGPIPDKCDTCDTPITTIFYDARTTNGSWAHMCPSCFTLGPGCGKLGMGYGQRYEKQTNEKFTKVAG